MLFHRFTKNMTFQNWPIISLFFRKCNLYQLHWRKTNIIDIKIVSIYLDSNVIFGPVNFLDHFKKFYFKKFHNICELSISFNNYLKNKIFVFHLFFNKYHSKLRPFSFYAKTKIAWQRVYLNIKALFRQIKCFIKNYPFENNELLRIFRYIKWRI